MSAPGAYLDEQRVQDALAQRLAKFIDLDEPAPVLVMPAQAHPLRKPVRVPYWGLCGFERAARGPRQHKMLSETPTISLSDH